jgi:sugar phosphate isomerase/epimerase
MTTFGYLYQAPLEASLESIARAGYQMVEIMAVAPHLYMAGFDWLKRQRLRQLLSDLGLTCISINANELNLISPSPELREVALQHYRQCIRLAHDLGAQIVNVIAGRQMSLLPMPGNDATELALHQLGRLAIDAHEYGVNLALETPHLLGFAESTGQLAALIRAARDERIGACIDVANFFGLEDVDKAVATLGPVLMMAHLSDTWRHRFAHTSLGRAEVDFPQYLAALRRQKFAGPCIYELLDGEDPGPRIAADLITLTKWGFSA